MGKSIVKKKLHLKPEEKKYVANRKLHDPQTNEEQAVKKAVEIFKNISTDLSKSSWKMTWFKKSIILSKPPILRSAAKMF